MKDHETFAAEVRQKAATRIKCRRRTRHTVACVLCITLLCSLTLPNTFRSLSVTRNPSAETSVNTNATVGTAGSHFSAVSVQESCKEETIYSSFNDMLSESDITTAASQNAPVRLPIPTSDRWHTMSFPLPPDGYTVTNIAYYTQTDQLYMEYRSSEWTLCFTVSPAAAENNDTGAYPNTTANYKWRKRDNHRAEGYVSVPYGHVTFTAATLATDRTDFSSALAEPVTFASATQWTRIVPPQS